MARITQGRDKMLYAAGYLPVIDWNVSVGNLLQIMVIVGGGLWVFFALRADVRVVKHDMANMKQRQDDLNEAFTQLGKILTQVAVQDQRIIAIERTVEELRHGQGFISPIRT